MKSDLVGRIKNTSLSPKDALMPIFEAIVNSIHSIEQRFEDLSEGKIDVKVIRNGQRMSFEITDNGIGFTDENFSSFSLLDSQHKAAKGCRGVGRLLWLKVFEKAKINSIYIGDGEKLFTRHFSFSAIHGIHKEENREIQEDEIHTSIFLDTASNRYLKHLDLSPSEIAKSIYEHCIFYMIRKEGVPEITLHDSDETLLLNALSQHALEPKLHEFTPSLKGNAFNISIAEVSAGVQKNTMLLCAASRVVQEISLDGKVNGLYGPLHHEGESFCIQVFVTSEFLDDYVRADRTAFDIEEEVDGLFEKHQVSMADIRNETIKLVSQQYKKSLKREQQLSRERVDSFVSSKAPKYKSILKHFDYSTVNKGTSEAKIEQMLHKAKSLLEVSILVEGSELLRSLESNAPQDINTKLRGFLDKVSDIKRSDLAAYVCNRKITLELLEKAIQRKPDGKYETEKTIHELIMPMGKTSEDVSLDECNLWLIDERLAFHHYLASDKPISSMPITDSEDKKRPDIVAFHTYDDPILVSPSKVLPLSSITIIELKRPMRNDAKPGEDHDPVEQSLNYLEKIREGGAKTKDGRTIPTSSDIPGFCYVICDLTPSVERRCKNLSLTPTHDHMGYFGYNPNHKAYIEVISYDRLVNGAKERNKAFFDKLGLPSM